LALLTRLTSLMAIKHPIVLAPMGAVAGGRLAAAVTRAGGLGMLGPGYADEAWIEREFDATKGERVGIGFITWDLARDRRRLDVALDRSPAAIMFSFGDPTPFVEAVRRSGAKLLVQVQTLEGARTAAQLGADIVVAQGTEAGGHGAARALFALLPAVVDAVHPIPVLAAGGICDGRGLAAALALGACGALTGTRFYATEESLAPPAAKARVVQGAGDQTVRTRVFDIARGIDWPAPFTGRALQNAFTGRWHGRESELAEDSVAFDSYAKASQTGDFDTAVVWAGEGVDLVRDIAPASRVVNDLIVEAEVAIARSASFLAPVARS
jgi:nitronate monooxygenase